MAGDLVSSQDIIDQALQFSGELTLPITDPNASEYRANALSYLNRVYKAILSGGNEFLPEMAEPFTWAVAPQPGVFALKPAITGIVSIAYNSTAGAFQTAPVDQYGNQVSVQDTYIRIGNFSDMYLVLAHTSGQTNFTVDLAYVQPSQTNIASTIYFLDYTLTQTSGILRLTAPMRMFQIQTRIYDGEIKGSDMGPMRREFPLSLLQTRYPDRFAEKSTNSTSNNIVIQINTNPPDNCRVEYDYVPYPVALTDDSSSFPVVPRQHLMVLAYGVAHYICVDKNDSRADGYMGKLQSGLSSMVKAAKKQRIDTNDDRGRLIPRKSQMRRRIAPWWWGF